MSGIYDYATAVISPSKNSREGNIGIEGGTGRIGGVECLRQFHFSLTHVGTVGKQLQRDSDRDSIGESSLGQISDHPNIQVSLDVELKDSYLDLSSGDEIVVYYDGSIIDEKAETVYAITLRTPANRETQ